MKTRLLLLCLSTSIALPACGAGSPDAYVEKSTKLACQYAKKCEEAMWEEAGFESVSDCVDKTLDTDLGGQGTLRDVFVAGCTNFDKGAARDCLAAGRKAKRSCDDMIDEPACERVCGTPSEAMGMGLGPDPLTDELVTRALEQMVENGELELELEPEGEGALSVEPPGQ